MLFSLALKLSPSMAMAHPMVSLSMPSSSQMTMLNINEDGHCNMKKPVSSHSASSVLMASMQDNESACCLDDCQCPTGACASVYALMHNITTIALIIGNEEVDVASDRALYILPDFQYRPPKLAHAG